MNKIFTVPYGIYFAVFLWCLLKKQCQWPCRENNSPFAFVSAWPQIKPKVKPSPVLVSTSPRNFSLMAKCMWLCLEWAAAQPSGLPHQMEFPCLIRAFTLTISFIKKWFRIMIMIFSYCYRYISWISFYNDWFLKMIFSLSVYSYPFIFVFLLVSLFLDSYLCVDWFLFMCWHAIDLK